MKDIGKISIILPCYRAEKCVGNMIGDVKRQTYTNWELFVVSNGSKQEAQLKVIWQCVEGDERIHVISIEQAGVSNARNEGMARMSGDWLAFVDADDRLSANHLELLAQGVSNDVDIVIGGFFINYRNASHPYSAVDLEPNHSLDRYFMSRGNMELGIMCNKLYNINKLRLWGGKFNPLISFGEDNMFFFQLLQFTDKINTIKRTGYIYTLEGLSSSQLRYHHQSTLETTYKELTTMQIELCRKVGYSDAELFVLRIKRVCSDAYISTLNLFKKSSPLSIVQQYRNVKRLVFDDSDVYQCFTVMRQRDGNRLYRMFSRLVHLRSPLLMTVVLNILLNCKILLIQLKLR